MTPPFEMTKFATLLELIFHGKRAIGNHNSVISTGGSHGPFGPPKGMKNDKQNCHPDRGAHGPPTQPSSGSIFDRAKRSGGTCCSTPLSRKCFSTERTRISYIALPETTMYTTLRRERRMNFINATTLNRKSGGAQWRSAVSSSGSHPDSLSLQGFFCLLVDDVGVEPVGIDRGGLGQVIEFARLIAG
jgi:hypothetical protein